MFGRHIFFSLFMLCAYFSCRAVMADPLEDRGIKIKAAVAYHVAKFISLPEEIIANQNEVRVCLIKGADINRHIEDMVHGKKLHGRSIRISYFEEAQELIDDGSCRIVFVSQSTLEQLRHSASKLVSYGKLIVCFVTELKWEICPVQIYEQDNKARIAIDLEWARRTGLVVSSELLDLAVVRRSES
ncbi:MAG: YfiR family protein [Bdellovibrionales bacterium]|nr:YfiR family protein [Bdellovibrionales bacterium]